MPMMPNVAPVTQNDLERGMQIALKISRREAIQKEREERMKFNTKKREQREAADARSRTLLFLEWFILGIILQPFVGVAYNALLKSAGVH